MIGDAEAAVASARAAGGEKLAPYETISAELYLSKAREEQGRAQYGAAKELAEQSLRFAQQAIERAGEGRSTRGGASPAPATITRSQPAPEPPAPPARDR